MKNTLTAIYDKDKGFQLDKEILALTDWKPGDSINVVYDEQEDSIYLKCISNTFALNEDCVLPITQDIADEASLCKNTMFTVTYSENTDIVTLKPAQISLISVQQSK